MCQSTSSDESLRFVTVLDERAAWLQGRQRNETSQFGEDGLIEALFKRIGEKNRWCFEVGAADGLFYSNTKRLRDAGWSSVLIEAGAEQFAELARLANDKTRVVKEKINYGSLDRILGDLFAPKDLDLGVIDIDGQDYWAWKGMIRYRPRVMLVEFAYRSDTSAQQARFVPPENGEGQAGFDAIVSLGKQKGYTPVISTDCNVLFVESGVWQR